MNADIIKSKIKKFSTICCDTLEFLVALLVLIAVVMALVALIPELPTMLDFKNESTHLIEFLEKVFTVVIGIEFLKMLCRPNSENILETLIFLVARHMVIVSDLSALDYLFLIISVVLLCVVRHFLGLVHKKQANYLEEKVKEALDKKPEKKTKKKE